MVLAPKKVCFWLACLPLPILALLRRTHATHRDLRLPRILPCVLQTNLAGGRRGSFRPRRFAPRESALFGAGCHPDSCAIVCPRGARDGALRRQLTGGRSYRDRGVGWSERKDKGRTRRVGRTRATNETSGTCANGPNGS